MIGCLFVADLPLVAHLRAVPEHIGRALAVAQGLLPQSRIAAVSPEAALGGVQAAMTLAQARALLPALDVVERSDDFEASAQAALKDAALAFSPRVEAAEPGTVYADLSGLGRRFETPAQLGAAIETTARRLGVPARVGIAPTKSVARLAALGGVGEGVAVVAAGEERAFLAPLSIEVLPLSAEAEEVLVAWGIRTLGAIARIDRGAIETRLGAEGGRLHRLACGELDEPLDAEPPPLTIVESVRLEYAIESWEALLFVLRPLLDRALGRVTERALGCGGLALSLDLDRSAEVRIERRSLSIAAPTREARTLLTLIRLELERRPPSAWVEGVSLELFATGVRPAQLTLFGPPAPAPDELATALARLDVIAGSDRVGAPVAPDNHRPLAAEQTCFTAESAAGYAALPPSSPQIVLRAIRPAWEAIVRAPHGVPVVLESTAIRGGVRAWAGPFRIEAEWWGDDPVARDYFDVELTDGGLYRIYRDRAEDAWYVDGIYD